MSTEAHLHMSAAHKGVPLSEKHKQNISLTNMGHVVSEETRKKLSVANKGNQNWLGKKHTEESKIKMSAVQKGKVISDDQKLKLSVAQKGKKRNLTPEQRAKIGEAHIGNKYGLGKTAWNKGKIMCQKTKDKISLAGIGRKCAEITKEKLSIITTKSWTNPVFIIKQQQAIWNRPNKIESKLYDMLDALFPDTYAYTGDFGFMIGGKNPDFVNMDENKTIDLFGDYWHRGQNTQERVGYFKKLGYKSLIIWEHELKNVALLQVKLLNFQYS